MTKIEKRKTIPIEPETKVTIKFWNHFRCKSINKEYGLTCVKDEGHDGIHEYPVSWYP